jgi:hypothetical protein
MDHNLFALKNWIVAFKTCVIRSREAENWLKLKVWSVTILQMSLIIYTQLCFLLIVGEKHCNLAGLYLKSPVYAVLLLLIVSFWSLKKYEVRMAISSINLAIFNISSTLYTTENAIIYF